MSETRREVGVSEEEEKEVDVDRCEKANEALCEECEKQGVKVCSWDEFAARQDYVEGKIEAPDLQAKASAEVSQHAKAFGKYLVVEDKKPDDKDQSAETRERAKQANKIYKKICQEEGLTVCFFSDFSSWSRYVKGEMADSEFHDQAKREVAKLLGAE